MIKFNQYLTEDTNAQQAFITARDYVRAHFDVSNPKGARSRFADGLDKFAKAAEAREIYNAAFKDTYSYDVTRGLEGIWQDLRNKHRDALKAIPGDDDFWGVNMQSVKKAHAFYTKNNGPAEVVNYLNAVVGLPDAIKVLKSYIKAGRPPKVTPPSSLDAAKAAITTTTTATHAPGVTPLQLLQQAVDSFKSELSVDTRKSFADTLGRIRHARLASELKNVSQGAKALATRVFITRSGIVDGARVTVLELKADADQLVMKLADETVHNIIEEFLHKNNAKLALIFKKKGSPTEHRIVYNRIQGNILENKMFFKFADGSSFFITSQAIQKYSVNGKPFVQMPTRFTDVTMGDGTKMSQPSEEKVLRSF